MQVLSSGLPTFTLWKYASKINMLAKFNRNIMIYEIIKPALYSLQAVKGIACGRLRPRAAVAPVDYPHYSSKTLPEFHPLKPFRFYRQNGSVGPALSSPLHRSVSVKLTALVRHFHLRADTASC